MRLIKYNTPSIEENLAIDEFVLLKAEAGVLGETLRFWSSEEHSVVLGRGDRAEENCFMDRCRCDGIKVLRRISGGGTVLQGPGCLNYSLVLSYEREREYRDIAASYGKILTLLSEGMKARGYSVEFFPVSDLALGGRKISGNAQARKKRYILHHGTFLCGLDIGKVSYYLKHPGKEPGYRKARAHGEFLVNVPFSRRGIEDIVKKAFTPDEPDWEPSGEDSEEINRLVKAKYADPAWNLAF
jgi:lipoate-protein ligase A